MKKILLPIVNIRKYLSIGGFVIAAAMLQSCGGGDGSPRIKEGKEETYMESTKGVITEVEEVKKDEYKIIDEKIIDDKSKSIAIVHNLNGTTDTVSLKKLSQESAANPRYSALNSVLMYGLAASFFSRNLANTSPNASYYKDQAAFNKSNGLKNDLTQSAATRRVTVPSGASKGYGGGKSFRSHGG